MKNLFTKVGLALALATTTMAAASFAQQQQTPAQRGTDDAGQHERMGHHGEGARKMGRTHGAFRFLRRLNLSDAQRQQIRTIHETYAQKTQAQRDELRQLHQTKRQGGQLTPEQQARAQQLRTELDATFDSIHGEILNVLTPEQRAQAEQMLRERKERGAEFRQRRHERQPDQQ